MEKLAATSQYLHIARDLAARIAKGEFPEGSKLFGRSMLASEYAVSPETIRRLEQLRWWDWPRERIARCLPAIRSG